MKGFFKCIIMVFFNLMPLKLEKVELSPGMENP